ncbi:glucan 1,3-beta-glucosidase 3 [Zygosaccharomyces mellis]|uniref:Glucan 1,3-beta-glucosidase 3 n=1 Tax=Zygosaccharomyces mellis TaxID=42258 RepID=A0A4C2DZY5_9SACH|nr:glucan 1,3-beta-glucosidase 3 [Zygosaccharomyces mellis]
MFDKLKNKLEDAIDRKLPGRGHGGKEVEVKIPGSSQINKEVIYRYRYNHAVNLGALFVLENWIYDDLFDRSGDTEYDAVSSQMKASGVEVTAEKLYEHYRSYVKSIDFGFLVDSGVTALRVPIGYWHVGNGQFLDGLPYSPLKKVYQSAKAWDVLKQLIDTASDYGIGILVDMHALPGGANADAHSGSNLKSASFFGNNGYVDKVCNQVLPFIVKDVCRDKDNVIGLQIVNEAIFDNKASGHKNYYYKAIKAIRAIDDDLPIVISDGWWPQQWADWLQQQGLDTGVVVDSHVYRCFSDTDKQKTAQEIINDLPNSAGLPKDQADYMVGEFSCVLDAQTWDKTQGDRDHLVSQYGSTETSVFSTNASWGWFFWTLQFQHGDGGEWGFIPMVNSSSIPRRLGEMRSILDDGQIQSLVQQHCDYWRDKGGDKMEHWRYEDALKSSIADVKAFAEFNNSLVGRWHSWKIQRRQQYIEQKGDSDYMWEWDQGYQKGLDECNHY